MSSKTNPFPRNANSASAPLPHIPRRSVSASRVHSLTSSPSPVKITVQLASPPEKQKSSAPAAAKSDSDSSSSSSSSRLKGASKKASVIRPKRGRTLQPVNRGLFDPPTDTQSAHNVPYISNRRPMTETSGNFERSSSTEASSIASSQPLIFRPGMPLKLTLEQLKSNIREGNGTVLSDMGAPIHSASAVPPPVIRKKSGQLLKSSLKASKPPVRGSLSVVTGAVASKSEPNTPKAVHFDSHLEHVKLFLAEQRPLAVSRDGSPTDETSGTESDFSPFVFGESADEQKNRKRLAMQVVNLPSVVDQKSDVALVELKLAADYTSIVGKVRVRNIAFHKWVAVRFTFDAWQTTSEVTGRYVESQKDFDIFSFVIRLDDLLARIDGKTLILAVRYTAAGKEFWDNNKGQNYLATFSKTLPPPPPPPPMKAAVSESAVADLRSRLEKVARNQEQASRDASPSLKSKDSLSSRYDFHASLKESLLSPTRGTHVRTVSSPADSRPKSLSPPPTLARNFVHKAMVQPKVTLGSPRDLDNDTFRPAPFVPSDLEDAPFAIPPVSRVARNHQRGYFDLDIPPFLSSSIRRTPPGTPPTRFPSFPPLDPSLGLGLTPRDAATTESGGSDQSTPSILSPSTSSPSSSSPSPTETFGMTDLAARIRESSPVGDGSSYNEFLDKFCFYTGSDSKSIDKPPPIEASATPHDESASRSGSVTPTSLYFDIPEISTPVML